MGTDKMKILPVLAFASAHAYTVFAVDAVCDLAATPAVECGVNEWCTTDKKCACVPGFPSTDGKACAETIAEKCDDTAAPCPEGSTCDAAGGTCDCLKADGCATEGTCDHFCNVIPVVETTAAVTTAVPETGTTVADNSTTAAPEGGSAMSYSLAISTLITLLLA